MFYSRKLFYDPKNKPPRILDIDKKLRLIMLILKNMAKNMYYISHKSSGIPYHKNKSVATLVPFKTKFKFRNSICSCRIFRNYIQLVGFI